MYYADDGISFLDLGFENDVNMYGTQALTTVLIPFHTLIFEALKI